MTLELKTKEEMCIIVFYYSSSKHQIKYCKVIKYVTTLKLEGFYYYSGVGQ